MDEEKILIGIDLSTASEVLVGLIIEDSVDASVFEEIARANVDRPEILRLLLDSPETPDEARALVSGMLSIPAKPKSEIVRAQKTPEVRTHGILQRIQKLNVSEKIQLALRGGKEIRTILMRDPNKEVCLTVLENPKLTDTEVELIARSRSIPDEALRKITKKREWMKNYNVMLALLTNPKLPPGIALPLVSELKTKDLAMIEKNKNVSEGLRGTAKKILRARKAH
jgi:hypothetical protein